MNAVGDVLVTSELLKNIRRLRPGGFRLMLDRSSLTHVSPLSLIGSIARSDWSKLKASTSALSLIASPLTHSHLEGHHCSKLTICILVP